jgi:DNA-binding CsgD family transcriptional regulator
VPCDSLGYNEVDLKNMTLRGDTDPAEIHFDGLEEALMSTIHQHPLASLQAKGDMTPRRISDFLSVREFHRLELYNEVYRRLGTEDQIALGLPGTVIVAISVNRSKRTFTERDLVVLELLRPQLGTAYRNLIERERVAALIWGLESGLERHDAAVIQVDGRGRVVHSSPVANELLTAYFGSEAAVRLPSGLASLLRTEVSLMTVETTRGRLRVQLLPDREGEWRSVFLEEQRTSPPSIESLEALGLTRRRAQVLRLLVCGKRNDEIAHELLISRETVRKHLEHIYRQLGVTSRAKAIALVLSGLAVPRAARYKIGISSTAGGSSRRRSRRST